jgi:hypothetical protein
MLLLIITLADEFYVLELIGKGDVNADIAMDSLFMRQFYF